MTLYKTIVEDIKAARLNFRINDLDEGMEFKSKKTGWELLTDTHIAIINLKMRQMGYSARESGKPSLTTFWEGVTAYAHKNRYNPITDYLTEVEKTYTPGNRSKDGIPQPYAIRAFAEDYFINPDGMFPKWLFRWMVGAAHRARTGSRNPMLTLAGDQHIGKSTWAEWLCPVVGRFNRGGIQPDNKDHRIRMANLFIWEIDELAGTTTRRNADSLKSFISQSEVFERLPFKKKPVRKIARCSLIGTANFDGTGFLADPTGSTRFLVTKLTWIDFSYTKKVAVDSLWAEAAYFASRFPGAMKLTPNEDERRREINSQYEVKSALGEVIDNLFEVTLAESDFMTTQEIQLKIGSDYRITNNQFFYNELARVMKKRGVKRHRQTPQEGYKRGWLGIRYTG